MLGVVAKALACNGLDGCSKTPVRIAGGDADGFGAEIETDQRAARRKERRRLGESENGHGWFRYHAPRCPAMSPAAAALSFASAGARLFSGRHAFAQSLTPTLLENYRLTQRPGSLFPIRTDK